MSEHHTSDHDDHLDVFLLPDAGVRGALVRLGPAWQQVLERSEPPAAARALLGQALVASALMTAHSKVEGRLSVQLRAPGALRSLFAECTGAHTLRGLVRTAEDADAAAIAAEADDLSRLGDGALLAITVENPGVAGEPMRYQGLVPLDSADLAHALEGYFVQSEQLPTRLLLAADADGASGLLLQKLPGAEGDDEGWTRAGLLLDTLGTDELQATGAELLLHRLFHQENLQLLGRRPLHFGCSCSRSRVEEVLRTLGSEEAHAAVAAGRDGRAEVHCEFCGQRYHFDRAEIDALFTGPEVGSTTSTRLH
ncbi:Hsp33 family molecular chaperone HslO [Luteimonas sp. e5]